MDSETKVCQNCQKDFIIEPEDFNFYKKIKVPPPTWCPECRMVKRMNFRNERSLYKRKCNLCKKTIISIYAEESPINVFCQDCWWGDSWDPFSFGSDYDFSKNFFVQLKDLYNKVPQMSLFNTNPVNSDYCNFSAENKNCYLLFGSKNDENVLYSSNSSFMKDSLDISISKKLELCYEDIQCENSNRLFFSKNSDNCVDSYFLYECKNCTNCFGCTNLKNKQYCFFNKQMKREEYLATIQNLNLGSYDSLQKNKDKFKDLYLNSIHRHSLLINTKECTGNNIRNARNCKYCFDVLGNDSENSKYTTHSVLGVKDSYDNYGMSKAESVYETIALGFESNENSDYKFSFFIKDSSDISYSINCSGSIHLFACVGLRNKSYCILNHQYTKEQYEELVPKIIKHMNDMPYLDTKGRIYQYGEFFPTELSPFCYNETIAQEYFPLTKEEALKQGYQWKDAEERNYTLDIKTTDIPDNIQDVDESILGKVIECEHQGKCNEQCTEAFKIIAPELQFYQRMNLPLPHLCPNCRHYQRLKQRNPLKLWHRACMCEKTTHTHIGKCPVEFETSYAPERPEIIYCERCYQQEIY
ncbi:MAG: hypothetical protein PHT16_03050 [Candidatus Pacebacteria bacterium]|nr:hypothetical protein [Candidatus Paceibacterota bacterium]